MRRRLALGPSAFSWQKICFYLGDGGLIEYDNLCVTVVYPAALFSPARTVNFNTFDQRMWKYLKSPLGEWRGLSWVALYSTVLNVAYAQTRTWKMYATLLTRKIGTLLKPKTLSHTNIFDSLRNLIPRQSSDKLKKMFWWHIRHFFTLVSFSLEMELHEIISSPYLCVYNRNSIKPGIYLEYKQWPLDTDLNDKVCWFVC